MKKDKFCISKTLVYLMVLVLVGVGFFYIVKNVNDQQKVTKSKADYGCPGGKWVTVTNNDNENTCKNYLNRMYPTLGNRVVTPVTTRKIEPNFNQVCCVISTKSYDCSSLTNIIKGVDTNKNNNNSNCAIYTGRVRGKGPYTGTPSDCEVRYVSHVYCTNPTPNVTVTYHPKATLSPKKFDQSAYCNSLANKIANYITKKSVKLNDNNTSFRYVGVRYFTGKPKNNGVNLAGPFYCALKSDQYIVLDSTNDISNIDENLYSPYNKDPYNMNNMYSFEKSYSDITSIKGCLNGLKNDEEGFYTPNSSIKVKCENSKLTVIDSFD
ncbi:MAG: hypothetical protein Fur009_3980 [Candidatus Microgenomates bacterium]